MKTTTIYTTLSLLLSFFLFSCSDTEDTNLFPARDFIIQNDGYLPLAPSNQWVYESYEATQNKNGVIVYDDVNEFTKEERFISNANLLTIKKDDGDALPIISYEFSPIADRGIIGGLLGNFFQVVKDLDTGEYYRTEFSKLNVVQNANGDIEPEMVLKLSEDAFLLDNITASDIGKRLFYEKKTIDVEVGIPFTIVYERYTEISGKYDRIPVSMASTPGVDSHLLNYKDIVSVSDYIKILEIYASVKTMNVSLDVEVILSKDMVSKAFINDVSNATSDGPQSVLLETDLIDIPGLPGIPLATIYADLYTPDHWKDPSRLGTKGSLRLTVFDFLIDATLCESRVNYKIQSKMDVPIKMMFDNDIPYQQDTYFARNVGIIKTVTTNKQLTGQMHINPNLKALDLGNIFLVPVDPYCVSENINTASLSLEIDPQINSFKSMSRMAIGEPAVRVVNLRKHNLIRKL